MQVFLTVLTFIIQNRADIIEIIKSIEALIPDAPGNEKAAAVKEVIGKAIGTEQQLETAWPLVQPIFNLLVASVKTPKK